MPREIFGEVSNPSVKLGSQAWYTVPLSILVHALLLAALIVVPLVAADVLPSPPQVYDIFVAAPDLPEPPPPPAAAPAQPRNTSPASSSNAAPAEAPDKIVAEAAVPPLYPGVDGGDPGLPPGALPSVLVSVPSIPTPPPPPQIPAFVRPGGNIKKPEKTHHVPPMYPAIAQQARVEGTVIIEAMIGIDGRVKDARVLRSQPLLDQAALDAVMQWRFTPTLLNGVPVPVLMTVTVTFTLR